MKDVFKDEDDLVKWLRHADVPPARSDLTARITAAARTRPQKQSFAIFFKDLLADFLHPMPALACACVVLIGLGIGWSGQTNSYDTTSNTEYVFTEVLHAEGGML